MANLIEEMAHPKLLARIVGGIILPHLSAVVENGGSVKEKCEALKQDFSRAWEFGVLIIKSLKEWYKEFLDDATKNGCSQAMSNENELHDELLTQSPDSKLKVYVVIGAATAIGLIAIFYTVKYIKKRSKPGSPTG